MSKNKLGAAAFLSLVAGGLSLVDIFLYRTVMYTYQPVFFMLAGAIVVAVLGCLLARVVPTIANYFPICLVFLLASALVWGAMLMVNQIGYVIAGLDGIDTIMSFIIFEVVCCVALLVALISAFLSQTKEV